MDLLTVLDAQEEFDANGEARRGEGAQGAEAADGARVAVDTSREDSEVAGSEGVGGVGEEGEDMRAFFVEGQVGFLQGCEAVVIDCTQRQRVFADQELENGGVVVAISSTMKGRVVMAIVDGNHVPLP